jgi:hypothetical protein
MKAVGYHAQSVGCEAPNNLGCGYKTVEHERLKKNQTRTLELRNAWISGFRQNRYRLLSVLGSGHRS